MSHDTATKYLTSKIIQLENQIGDLKKAMVRESVEFKTKLELKDQEIENLLKRLSQSKETRVPESGMSTDSAILGGPGSTASGSPMDKVVVQSRTTREELENKLRLEMKKEYLRKVEARIDRTSTEVPREIDTFPLKANGPLDPKWTHVSKSLRKSKKATKAKARIPLDFTVFVESSVPYRCVKTDSVQG
ncbi:hypothetical protein HDE_07492 [Halotydeus destructor]|nr:hypothetical protein HDE_07492 [Halotydeus destructor]